MKYKKKKCQGIPYFKFTYANTRISNAYIHEFGKKLNKKQSFHLKLTEVNCIKSNNIKKKNDKILNNIISYALYCICI